MHPIGTLFTEQVGSGSTWCRETRPMNTFRNWVRHAEGTVWVVLGLLALGPSGDLAAQDAAPEQPLTRMLFVMDASNSMNAF